MVRLHISDVTSFCRRSGIRPTLAKSLLCFSVVVLSVCALPHVASAQSPKPEADEPLTAEDIAAGVKAVNALKQDKAKVNTYCGVVDMLDDAEGDDDAAGKAATKKPVNPAAEEALDAKVEKIIDSLGEDFSDAYFTLEDLPENSAMGKPLAAAFDELDKSCDSESK
jgi:hypothetical protein